MNLRNRFALIAGSVLLAAGLLTGAAFASDLSAKTEKLEQAVAEGKLTQEQANLLIRIHSLRHSMMEQFKAERTAMIEEAVAAGSITQEQAEQLLTKPGMGKFGHGKMGHGGRGFKAMDPERMRAMLEAKVEAGHLTQEQAEQILSGEGTFSMGGFMKKSPREN